MEESILTSIKKLLGIAESDTSFDLDILMHLNSVVLALTQIGVGPYTGFCIEDDSTTWEDFIEEDLLLQPVKSYLYIKTRLLFDPPNSAVATSLEQMAAEFEWRIQHALEIMETEDA